MPRTGGGGESGGAEESWGMDGWRNEVWDWKESRRKDSLRARGGNGLTEGLGQRKLILLDPSLVLVSTTKSPNLGEMSFWNICVDGLQCYWGLCGGVCICVCVCAQMHTWNIIQPEFSLPICSLHVTLASQLGLFLIPCPPAGSHLKTRIRVSLAHLCWIHSGWFCSVSELTYEPSLRGRISQNAWFGDSLHWTPHYVGGVGSREEDRFFGSNIPSGCAS